MDTAKSWIGDGTTGTAPRPPSGGREADRPPFLANGDGSATPPGSSQPSTAPASDGDQSDETSRGGA